MSPKSSVAQTNLGPRLSFWHIFMFWGILTLFFSGCHYRSNKHLTPTEWLDAYSESKASVQSSSAVNSQENPSFHLAVKGWVHWLIKQHDLAQSIWQVQLSKFDRMPPKQQSDLTPDQQEALCLSALGDYLLTGSTITESAHGYKTKPAISTADQIQAFLDLKKYCYPLSTQSNHSMALSALAWSLGFHTLSHVELSNDSPVKSAMIAYLDQWLNQDQSMPAKSTMLKCEQDLNTFNQVNEYSFYKSYSCQMSCSSKTAQLMIKDPWHIKQIWWKGKLQSNSNQVQSISLFEGPLAGSVSLIQPYHLIKSPISTANESKADAKNTLNLTIHSSKPPQLLCGPRLPSFDRTIGLNAPHLLNEAWDRLLVFSLLGKTLDDKTQRFKAIDRQFIDLTWSLWEQAWHIPKVSNKTEQPEYPNNGSSQCINHTFLKNGLWQNSLKKDTGTFRDKIKEQLISCIKQGFKFPKAWFEPRFFEAIFASAPPVYKSVHVNNSEYFDELAWEFADHLIALGAPAQSVISPLVASSPNAPRSLSWLQAYPKWQPLPFAESQEQAIDDLFAEQLIKKFSQNPWPPLLKGHVGQLLDQQILYYNQHGQGLRRVLEIIRVNSRKGVEELGELRLPSQAQVIDLYQMKSNGGRRAPLEIMETEGYSFSDLQVGDWLVAHYIEGIETQRRDSSILTPKIPLQDKDRSIWRREISIKIDHKKSKKQEHHISLRPNPQDLLPNHSLRYKDSPKTFELKYVAKQSQAQKGEIFALPDANQAYLQVGDAHKIHNEISVLARYLQAQLFKSSQVCTHVQKLAPFLDLGSAQAIATWVWTHIQQDRPLFDSPSIHKALARGIGHRGLILSTILFACGHPHQIYLSRETRALHDPDLSCLDDVPYMLLKLNQQWLDPQLPNIPLGLVNPQYAGGATLLVWPVTQLNKVEYELIPRQSMFGKAYLDHEHIDSETRLPLLHSVLPVTYQLNGELHREWNAPNGVLGTKAFKGHMHHAFHGSDGAILFDKMSRAGDKGLKAWVEKQWSQWLGRAEVRKLEFNYDQQILKLNYQLRVWLRSGQKIAINPQQWGQRFASLKERKTSFYLAPSRQKVRLKLYDMQLYRQDQSPLKSEQLSYQAQPLSEQNSALWLNQVQAKTPKKLEAIYKLTRVDFDTEIKQEEMMQAGSPRSKKQRRFGTDLKAEWLLSGGLIEPKQYMNWKEFATVVDQKEQILIKLE